MDIKAGRPHGDRGDPGTTTPRGCMKQRRPALMFIILLALLTLACGSSITSGTVTSKNHQAAFTYIQVICAAYGNNGACTVYVPQTIYVPESWQLCLREDDRSGKPIKDRQEGCMDVSSDTWSHYQEGDYYSGKYNS